MRATSFFVPIILIFLIGEFSCKKSGGGNYSKTSNGLEYKIIDDEGKPKAQIGKVIKYHVYWRTGKDSLFLSTKDRNIPLYSKVDSPKFAGDPMEILHLLGPGDSASCQVKADLIFRGSPPSFLHHDDVMKLDFKVMDVMDEGEYDKLMQEKANEQATQEQKTIEDYISKNNLKAEKTPDGLYVVIETPGTGKQPSKGSNVKVNYTGMLLDGTKFDSSLDPGRQPLEFVIGTGQVIKGWDEGIPHFKEGGKGKLIVPSNLGYGEQGAGDKIPPNSPLVFDIQLLEVK